MNYKIYENFDNTRNQFDLETAVQTLMYVLTTDQYYSERAAHEMKKDYATKDSYYIVDKIQDIAQRFNKLPKPIY